MDEHYDVIIVGTGAGGGTIAHELALAGKKLLVLERGPFLPREKQNWDTTAVFSENRYHTTETWTDHNGKTLHPGTGYWVGGNTKVYGAAMFRLTPLKALVVTSDGQRHELDPANIVRIGKIIGRW